MKFTENYPTNLLDEVGIEDLPTDINGTLAYVLAETLTEREKNCIEMYYGREMNLQDIGKEYGVTRERIRQIIAKGVRKLRHPSRLKLLERGIKGTIDYERSQSVSEKIENITNNCEMLVGELSKIFGSKEMKEEVEFRHRESIDLVELDLSVRSYNCLIRAGYKNLEQLSHITVSELQKVRNLGKRSFNEVVETLKKYGIDIETGGDDNA